MEKLTVTFPSSLPESDLQYVVIGARYHHQWLFVQHKQRNTYEIPGGHIEPSEHHANAARRELYEETGATEFTLHQLGPYVVSRDGKQGSGGMLYAAEVIALGDIPVESEIGQVHRFGSLPDELTYPSIQPYLQDKLEEWLHKGKEQE